jgi:peptide/nickel transport system substrate-binding protein
VFQRARPSSSSSGPIGEWDRRAFLKAGGISLAALAAACGAGGGPGGGSAAGDTLTLKMPLLADMQVPGPDVMYEGEGAQLMEFAYEGLVRYRPGPAEIRLQLAKSWTLSPTSSYPRTN